MTPGVIPDSLLKIHSNPIDQQIAIASYEMVYDAPKAFNRLEQALQKADASRRMQIESLLFINYVNFSEYIELERSLDWLKRAAQIKPDDPRPHRKTRDIYCLNGKYKECLAAHRRTVDLSDDEVGELTTLAGILQSIAKYSDASDVVEAAMRVESKKNSPNPKVLETLQTWNRNLLKQQR